MTAHAMKGDRERCLESGMDDYAPKPVSASSLCQAIYRVLPLKNEAASPVNPADGEAKVGDTGELACLLDAFNNDVSLFRDVAGMFASDYPPMVDAVDRAILDENGAQLSRTAHALKGMARNFQIADAADTARQLERLAEQGRFDAAQQLARRLADELSRYDRRLREMVAQIGN